MTKRGDEEASVHIRQPDGTFSSTSASGEGAGPRVAPDREWGETLVMGKFKARTRTTVANREAMAALQLIGVAADVDYMLGAPTTPTVVKFKMNNWAAVTRPLTRVREVHVVSEWAEGDGRLWALRGRSPGERARTAPAARAHRRIRELLEEWRLQGWGPA